MSNALLTACIVNKEALFIARAFPRDPDDGLFAYRARVDASWQTLIKTLEEFSAENLAPAMLEAWDKRQPYPDTPLRLPPSGRSIHVAWDVYSGFTGRTVFVYGGTDQEIFEVEIRVGDDA